MMRTTMFHCTVSVFAFLVTSGCGSVELAFDYWEEPSWPRLARSVADTPTTWNFGQVVAVATANDGNVLVLHRGANPVMVFSPAGEFVRAWGDGLFSHGKVAGVAADSVTPTGSRYSAVYGAAGCHACGAHAVRVDPDGHIWLVDAPGHVIYKMTSDGDVLLRLGTQGVAGVGPDTFNLPTDVGFSPGGDIYVSDGYGNARVVKFSSDGTYLSEWGSRGTGPGEFGLPHGIAVDDDGQVYVVDRDNRRVQVFDGNGTFLDEWTDLVGVQTVFVTKAQQIWTGGTLRTLDGEPLAELVNGGGGHGLTVVDTAGTSSPHAVFVAQLSGRVQKFNLYREHGVRVGNPDAPLREGHPLYVSQ